MLVGVCLDRTNASAIVSGGAGAFGSATVRGIDQTGARVVIAAWTVAGEGLYPAGGVWAARGAARVSC